MLTDLWKINGQTLEALGLAAPRLDLRNMQADTLTLRHELAAWDADPLWAYGADVVLTRAGVTVFRGKRRAAPRFAGAEAESLSYEIEGPWGWLERRILLQNTAVVLDPEESSIPVLLPQGLLILGQSDAGSAVNLGEALGVVLAAAIAAGVPIAVGTIAGFDFGVAWDEVADLTYADAIVRLLQLAPDAVVSWDYAPALPTVSIRRRAALPEVALAIAPAGEGGAEGYAEFESIRVRSREDLRVASVHLTYRRINTVNGQPYLSLVSENAGGGAATDENALVRTITLAGSAVNVTTLEQPVAVAPLSALLTTGGTITEASNAAAFLALSKFWKRKIEWLAAAGVTIRAFRATSRRLADQEAEVGAGATLDAALNAEILEGQITDWMTDSGLNRKAQYQVYGVEVLVDKTINGVVTEDRAILTGPVLASNCETRTYRWSESASAIEAEPAPVGAAAALLAALGTLQHDGQFTVAQEECDLALRPGLVANLTGGRAEWATMGALVQSVSCDLEEGRTVVEVGWPRALGPDDLVEIARANRFKKGADTGLIRTKGTL